MEEEAELKRKYDEYDEISNQKFEQMFRRGLTGLIVESLEMDSWFGGNKKKDQVAKAVAPLNTKENNHNGVVERQDAQRTFVALANNTV